MARHETERYNAIGIRCQNNARGKHHRIRIITVTALDLSNLFFIWTILLRVIPTVEIILISSNRLCDMSFCVTRSLSPTVHQIFRAPLRMLLEGTELPPQIFRPRPRMLLVGPELPQDLSYNRCKSDHNVEVTQQYPVCTHAFHVTQILTFILACYLTPYLAFYTTHCTRPRQSRHLTWHCSSNANKHTQT